MYIYVCTYVCMYVYLAVSGVGASAGTDAYAADELLLANECRWKMTGRAMRLYFGDGVA